jgi:electron transport complex protein RnfG
MSRSSVFTTMVAVAMACGFAIALVFQATAGQIERNRAALLEEAVGQVLPGTATTNGYAIDEHTVTAVAVDQAEFITGYDDNGTLIGVAIPASIMGYQDTIRMLFGYDPSREVLTGFAVLASRETPGLGSKIGTDPAFLASLTGLDLRLAGSTLANEITLATRGDARESWQIDGITGATISSNAVIQAINAAAPRLVAIRARLPEIEVTAETQAASEESGDA